MDLLPTRALTLRKLLFYQGTLAVNTYFVVVGQAGGLAWATGTGGNTAGATGSGQLQVFIAFRGAVGPGQAGGLSYWGRAKATRASEYTGPYLLPPPAAITTYCFFVFRPM